MDLVDLSESSSSPRKAPAPSRGLHRTSNVRPAEERGDIWEDEVHDRLREVIGRTSPTQPLSQQTLQRSPRSPVSPVTLPGTQPLGESSLARRYPRSPSTPEVEETLDIPLSPLSDSVELPPSSQSKLRESSHIDEDFGGIEDIDDIENRSPILQPFRAWGVARAEGLLPRKRSSASISPVFDRRYPLTFPR